MVKRYEGQVDELASKYANEKCRNSKNLEWDMPNCYYPAAEVFEWLLENYNVTEK